MTGKLITVLMISRTDWANMGAILSKSLRSIGVESRSICFKPHELAYDECSEIVNKKQAIKLFRRYDVIQFMHSVFVDLDCALGNKNIFVFHGGSGYRKYHRELLKFWKGAAKAHIIQTADLLHLGARPEEWLLPPVDTVRIQPCYANNKKRVLMHCPSMPRVKGTEDFHKVIEKLEQSEIGKDFEYRYGETTSWGNNIERISDCDIYFDACQLEIEGRPYGFWGMSALEAAALGKVVITHFNHNQEEYCKQYGKHNLKIANSMAQVEEQLIKHITMDEEDFREEQRKTRRWVERNHSMKAIGARLLAIYEKYSSH